MTIRIAAVAALLTGGVAAVDAEDWPNWRGVRHDGTWKAPPLPDAFPAGGLKTVWKVEIGGGYAGVAVADGRVFTMDRRTAPTEVERVLCLDAASGKTVWTHEYPVAYAGLDYGNGPRSTPTVHDGRVYTLGAVGAVRCLEAATGRLLWSKDLPRDDEGRRDSWWGYAASPLIQGDLCLIHARAGPEACLVAYDRRDGREVWRSLPGPAGYCTPYLVDAPSGRQLVVWNPEHIRGVDPRNGRPLWSVPYKVTYGVSIAGPIYHDGVVFITGYWHGSKAIRLGPEPTDAALIWEDNRALRGLMAQPLLCDGRAYSIDKQFGLTCFEVATGRKLWDDGHALTPKGRNPHASLIRLHGTERALALNSIGELVMFRLDPAGYRELSRARVLDGKVWSHPAFADRFLFAHTDGAERPTATGNTLVCVELTSERGR